MDAKAADARNIAAICWEEPDGRLDLPWHITWWLDGEIYRDIAYAADSEEKYALIPRESGQFAVLLTAPDGGELPRPEGYAPWATQQAWLCDWGDSGLENKRLLASGVIDCRTADNGAALMIYENGKTFLALYDGQGYREALIPMEAGVNDVIRAARDATGLWVVTANERGKQNAYRPLVIRDGHTIWQGEPSGFIYSAFTDGQGGYFVVNTMSKNRTDLIRYDGNASRLWKKELSCGGKSLGALPRLDSETGHTVAAGLRTAKSQGIYQAYRLELDEKGRRVSLDVREYPGVEEISASLTVIPGTGEIWLLIDRYDETGARFIPFESLPAIDDPGVRIN
ncbi:MAG: hypothetical protein IJ157_13405 [Clostridia bacterium]|nr:hypothetical protein [Clostridia bacterium]